MSMPWRPQVGIVRRGHRGSEKSPFVRRLTYLAHSTPGSLVSGGTFALNSCTTWVRSIPARALTHERPSLFAVL